MGQPRVFERLERITAFRSEYYEIGHSIEEIEAAAEYVRSKGHQAASVCADGFRYRSVYPDGSMSGWNWIEPGGWLCHMEGERQDPEFDLPHASGPDEHRIYPHDEWHEVTP